MSQVIFGSVAGVVLELIVVGDKASVSRPPDVALVVAGADADHIAYSISSHAQQLLRLCR